MMKKNSRKHVASKKARGQQHAPKIHAHRAKTHKSDAIGGTNRKEDVPELPASGEEPDVRPQTNDADLGSADEEAV